jgi:hypothetical protein
MPACPDELLALLLLLLLLLLLELDCPAPAAPPVSPSPGISLRSTRAMSSQPIFVESIVSERQASRIVRRMAHLHITLLWEIERF